ncbi:sulfate adenylyltransferase subunit CysN [Psychrobium sp. 1_MG-2023]|uniref:sulfate adenylyltransferase subunit CysN n=1 Tax=Psychrobium sp. 1_MG-2023 TaxID=3062624 RepID=UPI000C338A3E|nr:sulfate adenylyltransferase subunit CysN [Psychrobium sp. 1_MG-2023]MDP2560092.1 sulfate adenylyltransferase subunit CysN [Psychrobium sp. 1_MG-2023]PKF56250.1 sulfate adenylyltransferase subunit CysN [Alteromonadales bacterium alter-6D02]
MNNENIAAQINDIGVESYLELQQHKSLLRLLTCGSVDDGKSTLIGRLLHDSAQIYEDQLAALKNDSQKMGTTGEAIDLALLVDGLVAEREQGITIDVAYRYFSTNKRKFIIADTPGHEQYTRNMATGASTCDLAVILIDARYGVQVQTKRHSFIASLLGIKHFIVAVNKMDLVDFDETVYNNIREDYLEFVGGLGERDIQFVPMSALNGDNVVNRSQAMPWYQGETMLHLLETVKINDDVVDNGARLPVQYVNRPNLDFRGFCGTLASGTVNVGDNITVLPSGKTSSVKSIVTFEGELPSASRGQAITLTLNDEVDVSRGDMLVTGTLPLVSQAAKAKLVWMGEKPLEINRQYDLKIASKKTQVSIGSIDHLINVNTLVHEDASELALNEVAQVQLNFAEKLAFDLYNDVRDTGGFILIDRLTNVTVAAGMIEQSVEAEATSHEFSEFELEFNQLVRKHFPHWQALDISALKGK